MKITKIILILITLIIIISVYLYFTLFIPQKIDGTIKINGLSSPIQIIRDRYGIPYIKAENQRDLFFGIGFVNAQDRLWQMELLRRISQGRMAEVMGDSMVQNDIFIRTIGLDVIAKKQMEKLSDDTRAIFQAFTDGINEGIRTNRKKPIEFYLTGIQSEPWRIEDSFTIFELLMWNLSYNFKFEGILAQLVKEIGARKALELIPPDGMVSYKVAHHIEGRNDMFASNMMPEFSLFRGASNAWVVDGSRSVTGGTIVASDSHLSSVGFPCPFYIIHGEYPGFEVTGMMLPGVPCFLLGVNQNVSWVVTNNGADVQDLYIEKTRDNTHFLYKGQWKSLQQRTVSIKIKEGKGTYRIKEHIISRTHNGPVIKNIDEHNALSLRWCDDNDSTGLITFYTLLFSKTVKEFTALLQDYRGIPLNLIYADLSGGITHHTVGHIPKRKKGYGSLPSKGWEGENEWREFIPFSELPHEELSADNYLVVTNAKLGSPQGIFIPGIYSPDSRTERVKQLLNEKEKYSVQDMMDMQMDVRSLICRNIWEKVKPSINEILDSDISEIAQIMNNWHGDHDPDAIEPLIFNTFLEQLIQDVFEDDMNKELLTKYVSHWYYFIDRFYYLLTTDKGDAWFDNLNTAERETKKEIIQQSFIKAVKTLRERLGHDKNNWQWGGFHTLSFQHFLGKKGLMKKLLNTGPFPYGGGIDTLNRASYMIGTDFKTNFATTCRMIVDFSDIKKVYFVINTGQSGDIFSPFSRDQIELFLKGSFIEIDARTIEAAKHIHTLNLSPQ